jgi:hypothetical protein
MGACRSFTQSSAPAVVACPSSAMSPMKSSSAHTRAEVTRPAALRDALSSRADAPSARIARFFLSRSSAASSSSGFSVHASQTSPTSRPSNTSFACRNPDRWSQCSWVAIRTSSRPPVVSTMLRATLLITVPASGVPLSTPQSINT